MTADDPGDLEPALDAASVPVLLAPAAADLDEARDQIERLGEATGHAEAAGELATSASQWFLDIRSRRAWPGPYLAKITGCRARRTELPEEALMFVRGRAVAQAIPQRSGRGRLQDRRRG